MIKANELRKNNWINYKGNPICLIGNYDLFKACVDCERTEDYKPIPLTEEILLKCGFEYNNRNYCFLKPVLGEEEENPNFFFAFEADTVVLRESFEEIYITEVLFLHQLQNLYFALTGEELKIEI